MWLWASYEPFYGSVSSSEKVAVTMAKIVIRIKVIDNTGIKGCPPSGLQNLQGGRAL